MHFPNKNSLFLFWPVTNLVLQHCSEIVASEKELSSCNSWIMLAWRPLFSMRKRVRARGASSSLHPCEISPSPSRGGGLDLTFFAGCFSTYECSALFHWPWEFTDVENIWHWRSLFPPLPSLVPLGVGEGGQCIKAGICGAQGERLLKHH